MGQTESVCYNYGIDSHELHVLAENPTHPIEHSRTVSVSFSASLSETWQRASSEDSLGDSSFEKTSVGGSSVSLFGDSFQDEIVTRSSQDSVTIFTFQMLRTVMKRPYRGYVLQFSPLPLHTLSEKLFGQIPEEISSFEGKVREGIIFSY